MSVYSAPLSLKLPTKQTFQDIFNQSNHSYQVPPLTGSSTTYAYSLLINPENNSIQFILDTVIPILSVKPTFFDGMTIVIDDATFMLLPELYYWIFAQHPEIHFMPKITIGATIQSIYFPQNFLNETGFIQQDSTQILRNDWASQKYLQQLQQHFIGFYIAQKENYSKIFTLTVKNPTLTFTSSDNTTEPSLITAIQSNTQNNPTKAFVIALTGESQFLIDTIQSFTLALNHLESTSTDSFMGLPPNLLFNKLT